MADKKKKKTTRHPVVPIAKPAAAQNAHAAKNMRGGLGKGLDALISRGASASGETRSWPDETAPHAEAAASLRPGGGVLTVPPAKIKASPWQPRHEFDEASLNELTDSVRVHGIIQPLVCRSAGDGSYELIGGERRLRAANAAGLAEVPIIVLDVADRDAAELALVENLQREDLNVIEEAEAYKSLSENFSLTQEEIAERVGKARASVANALRLLELPDEVKQMLVSGAISAGHAKIILGADSDAERVALASDVVKNGLTVRILESKIAKMRTEQASPGAARKAALPDIPQDYQTMLLDKIMHRFGTGARLFPSMRYQNGRRTRGRLEIDFMDNRDLDRLLGLLGVDVNE